MKDNLYKLFMFAVLGVFVLFYAAHEWARPVIEAAEAQSAPGRVDAVVVLTGGKGRVEEGLRLLRAGVTDTLILSGVNGAATVDSIYMGRVDKALGERIILEKVSKSTYENAVETRRIVEIKGVKSVLLITSWYHLKRAENIFRAVMPKAVSITARAAVPPNPEDTIVYNFNSTLILTSEFLKYLFYAASGRG